MCIHTQSGAANWDLADFDLSRSLGLRRVASKFVLACTFGCFIKRVFTDVVKCEELGDVVHSSRVCCSRLVFFVVESYHMHVSFGIERAPLHRPSGVNNFRMSVAQHVVRFLL